MMTGPAEWEFSGTFDPATGEWSRDTQGLQGSGNADRGCLMSVEIVTFGCRLNTYESEVMKREADAAGLGTLKDGAIIFNTCAVTAEAVRQARQAIRKARRENPDARIIVTGCAAQTEADNFAAMGEVDLVLGNEEKLKSIPTGCCRISALTSSKRCASTTLWKCAKPQAIWSMPLKAGRALSCRCKMAATTAVLSASFPMGAAIRVPCRWAQSSIR